MKVIFLDHDGVLNNSTFHDYKRKIIEVGIIYDTNLISNFKKLVRECVKRDITIVSSSGYMFITNISESYKRVVPSISKVLHNIKDDPFMDISNDEFRSKFIRQLIDFDKITHYLIIDDYPDMFSKEDKDRLVCTSQLHGLNKSKLKEVMNIIKEWD